MKRTILAIGLMSLALGRLAQAEDPPPTPDQHADPAQEKVDATFAKLEKIRIPKVSMEDTTLEEAVDFLRLRTSELESDPTPKRVASPPVRQGRTVDANDESAVPLGEVTDEKTPRISYSGTDKTVATLLKEFAKQTKLDVYVTSVGIVFCRSGQPPFPDEKAAVSKRWKLLFKYDSPQNGSP